MDCIEIHSALCFLLCVHKHSERSINNCLGLWFTVNLITDKTWIKPLRSSLLSRVIVMKFEVWQKRQHRAWTQRLIQKYKRWIFCLRWSEVTYWGSFRTRFKASGENRIPVERRCHTFYHSCSSLFQRSEASCAGSTDIEDVLHMQCWFFRKTTETKQLGATSARCRKREGRPSQCFASHFVAEQLDFMVHWKHQFPF